MGIALFFAASLSLILSDRITIAPGYYSLPQLAEQLSSPDHPVRCSHSLKNRLAYVSIQGKQRKDVETDVSKTFGIDFVKTASNTYTIEPNLERQSQERRMARSLENYYGERLNGVMAACATLLPNVSPAMIDANTDRLSEKQKGPALESAAHLFLKLGNGDLSPLAYYVLAKGVDFSSLLHKDAIELGSEYDLESVVPPTWKERLTLRPFFERGTKELPISAQQREALIHAISAESLTALRLSFDPYSGELASHLSVTFHPDANSGAIGNFGLIPDEIAIDYPRLVRFGDDLWGNSYLKRRIDTKAFLDSASGADLIESVSGSRSISEFVATWAQTKNQDVIMEVSQGRDFSPSRFESGRRISTNLTREIVGLKTDFESESIVDSAPSSTRFTREATQAVVKQELAEPTYTACLDSGVLCVRDEFAFLDHAYGFPSAAIAKLESSRTKSSVPSLAAIEAFCLGTTAEEAGIVSRFRCALVPPDIANAYPILHSVFASKTLRQSLLDHVETNERVVKELGNFKDFNVERFCIDLAISTALSDFVTGRGASPTANCLYPTLAATLKESVIEVVLHREGSVGMLSFTFKHRHYLPIPVSAPNGSLTHESGPDDMVPVLTWTNVQFAVSE